jgi:hypothetical protein
MARRQVAPNLILVADLTASSMHNGELVIYLAND